jgi:ribosomal protein L7/L12
MTPRMKKILKELKKLNAYELALLDSKTEGVSVAIITTIRGLDEHLRDLKNGMVCGITVEELELGRTKKIQAIKKVRERAGVGLADAKRMVEDALNHVSLVGMKDVM